MMALVLFSRQKGRASSVHLVKQCNDLPLFAGRRMYMPAMRMLATLTLSCEGTRDHLASPFKYPINQLTICQRQLKIHNFHIRLMKV